MAAPARRRWGWIAAVAFVLPGCGGGSGTPAAERAVVVETTACGHASGTVGSGVVVGPGRVLTAAHVVAGAGEVDVVTADRAVPASIVVLDASRDLALLEVSGVAADAVELVQLAAGDTADVVGGAASGSVATRVTRRVQMTVDDVRSAARSRRAGYELEARIARGDSGAGLYEGDRLAGIVFAAPTGRDASFAVRAEEIAAVVGSATPQAYVCDRGSSQVVAAG